VTIYFPDLEVGEAGQPDSTGSGSTARLALPAELLERHGARELRPGDVPLLPGQPPVGSTVYRVDTLLVPQRLVAGTPFAPDAITQALAPVNMAISRPPLQPIGSDPDLNRLLASAPDLPIRVRLVPTGAAPVSVDAFVAVQAVHAAGAEQARQAREATLRGHGEAADLTRLAADLAAVSLEHLLVGAAVITGAPGATEGSSGPGADLPTEAGVARSPVQLLLDPPAPRLPGVPGPVVAVLDTGIGPNRWLGIPAVGDPLPPAGFITVHNGLQQLLLGEQVAGGSPKLLSSAWEDTVADPLVGELDTHAGHGTFIAGIIRQAAPDVRVLAIRIMHSDGIVYEGDLRLVLGIIAAARREGLAGGRADPDPGQPEPGQPEPGQPEPGQPALGQPALGQPALGQPDSGQPDPRSEPPGSQPDLRSGPQRPGSADVGEPVELPGPGGGSSPLSDPDGYKALTQVQVVSLSLGYFAETPADQPLSTGLADDLAALREVGVVVAAAAGNQATARPFYPAALADGFDRQEAPLLLAVGALNPNGSAALFSNDGPWLTCWASGVAVVSTFPEVSGGRLPGIAVAGTDPQRLGRETVDSDDYSSGFAQWSGTSFAAPLVAAAVAQQLAVDAYRDRQADDPNGTGGGDLEGDPVTGAIVAVRRAVSGVRAQNGRRPFSGRVG
jgi:Subtilase family